MFGSSEPVELGKKYGIYIDGPDDHHSHWEQLKRVKGLTILSPFLQEFGPDNWPRGRVLFNTALKRFEIDMSHHLHEPQFMAKILDFFRLPEAFSSFKRDPHYAKTRFIFGPEGPREQYDTTVSLLS